MQLNSAQSLQMLRAYELRVSPCLACFRCRNSQNATCLSRKLPEWMDQTAHDSEHGCIIFMDAIWPLYVGSVRLV